MQAPHTYMAGIGVAEFPEPEEIEKLPEIADIIRRNKSQLYDKSDIIPTLKKAKTNLQKEIIRCSTLLDSSPLPRIKGWTCGKCIAWLKDNPLPLLSTMKSFSALLI